MRSMQKIARGIMRGARRNAGFTLIELLVVIIIIAILAAIAIPAYFGQREQANDSAAFTLVRNALTAVQTAYVETRDYTEITAAALSEIETSIEFVQCNADLVTTSPPGIEDSAAVAEASAHQVAFYPESSTVMDIASRSGSGNWFGIQLDNVNISETGYVKVKLIDGSADLGW